MAFKLLFIGDVVGRPGRRVLANRLSGLCSRLDVDLVVANGENAAGGAGITLPPPGNSMMLEWMSSPQEITHGIIVK